jgi:hypothetical protein
MDATVAARSATVGYGRDGRPEDPDVTKTTAAPGTQAPTKKPNRRRTSPSR